MGDIPKAHYVNKLGKVDKKIARLVAKTRGSGRAPDIFARIREQRLDDPRVKRRWIVDKAR